jgi:hypothetical protein
MHIVFKRLLYAIVIRCNTVLKFTRMKKLNKKIMTCNLDEIPTIFFMKLSFDQR